MLRVYNHTAPSIAQEHAGCLDAAQRAIAIDRGDHLAYLYRGMLLLHSDRQHEGLADVRRAHELNPNDSFVLALLGLYEAGAGDPALGLRYAAEAIRRSPRDPERHLYLGCVGWAHFHAGDYQAAVDAAQRSIVDAPRFPPSHWCITLAWVGCGWTRFTKSTNFTALSSPRYFGSPPTPTWLPANLHGEFGMRMNPSPRSVTSMAS